MKQEVMDLTRSLPNLTPKEIVAQLDHFIVGQVKAKRACAIALRNRRRRQLVKPDLRDEILPKNILMIGSTGVGKTEIARRLAKLAHSPFIKVEASKFTEVGYVGRDVESIVRDLMEISIAMVKEEQAAVVRTKAKAVAVEKLLDIYLPPIKNTANLPEEEREKMEARLSKRREKYREEMLAGNLDTETVELEVQEQNSPSISVFNGSGMEEIGFQIREMLPNIFGQGKTKQKQMTIHEALERLTSEEEQKLIDMDGVVRIALARVENSGIVFLDEIDKIAGSARQQGPDVSRQGVQRDLLPLIEGCTVNTKYGMVSTDHILFIAAGAFHVAKPSDLLPELQGRLPIQVELESLTEEDFRRILVEPDNSLIKQNQALLETEGVELHFSQNGIEALASVAYLANENRENIGARRLHAVMEMVLEELFFDATDRKGESITVDESYVRERIGEALQSGDMKKYIL